VERACGFRVQERAIRQWASSHGHRLVALHQDAGVSGSDGLAGRVALADVLAGIPKEVAAVVVYRLDRLARNLILQEQLLAEVWRRGGQVFSTAEGESGVVSDDLGDPSRRFIRQLLCAVAENERAMIALRLTRGRARKSEAGGFAYGSPPFGWRAEDGVLVRDDREQVALGRIKELAAAGSSLREVARVLRQEGHRPKRGGRWHPEIIRRLLNSSEGDADPAIHDPRR